MPRKMTNKLKNWGSKRDLSVFETDVKINETEYFILIKNSLVCPKRLHNNFQS